MYLCLIDLHLLLCRSNSFWLFELCLTVDMCLRCWTALFIGCLCVCKCLELLLIVVECCVLVVVNCCLSFKLCLIVFKRTLIVFNCCLIVFNYCFQIGKLLLHGCSILALTWGKIRAPIPKPQHLWNAPTAPGSVRVPGIHRNGPISHLKSN